MLFYHHLFVFLCNCYHWAIAIGMTSQYRDTVHMAYKLSGTNSKLYNLCKQYSIYFTPEDIASGNPSFQSFILIAKCFLKYLYNQSKIGHLVSIIGYLIFFVLPS